jgi:hypothetical protein
LYQPFRIVRRTADGCYLVGRGARFPVVGDVRPRWVTSFDATFHKSLAACEPSPYCQALDALDVRANIDVLRGELQRQETRALEPPVVVHDDLERLAKDY